MSEEAAKRYCEAYDAETNRRAHDGAADQMAAAHRAGLAAVVEWERGRWQDKCAELEALSRSCDVALLRAGVANDGSAVKSRIAVLGERCDKAENEAHRLGVELADERAAVLLLKKDREGARRERDAAQAEAQRLTAKLAAETARANLIQVHREQAEREIAQAREQFGVPRPVLSEEQANRTARRLCIEMGVGEMHIGRIARALMWGDDGEPVRQQPETRAPKDEQASAKPFPMPGTRWRWNGDEQAPAMAGSRVVEGLRWFCGRVEAVFDSGDSVAGVTHMMTLDAWEFLGSEEAPAPKESGPAHGDAESCPSCSAIFGRPSPCAMTHEFGPPDDSIAAGPDPLERLDLEPSASLVFRRIEAHLNAGGGTSEAFALLLEHPAFLRFADAEDDVRDLYEVARQIKDRLARLEAAKPARPRVGRWVTIAGGHLSIFDDRGHAVATASQIGTRCAWHALRPFARALAGDAPTLEAAQAAALAVIRTWADVEGDEQASAPTAKQGSYQEGFEAGHSDGAAQRTIDALEDWRALPDEDRIALLDALNDEGATYCQRLARDDKDESARRLLKVWETAWRALQCHRVGGRAWGEPS